MCLLFRNVSNCVFVIGTVIRRLLVVLRNLLLKLFLYIVLILVFFSFFCGIISDPSLRAYDTLVVKFWVLKIGKGLSDDIHLLGCCRL